MQSKSTSQLGYTPEQLDFINLYLDPTQAAATAKALRMLCIAALESKDGQNPQNIADALFLAEMLLEVSLTSPD